MFPTQLTVIRPEEFSRCDERIQQRDRGNAPSPMHRSDASLKISVEHAIWKDEVLRAIEYHEIDVLAKNGSVHLNGHITNTTSRIRIKNAVRSIPYAFRHKEQRSCCIFSNRTSNSSDAEEQLSSMNMIGE